MKALTTPFFFFLVMPFILLPRTSTAFRKRLRREASRICREERCDADPERV